MRGRCLIVTLALQSQGPNLLRYSIDDRNVFYPHRTDIAHYGDVPSKIYVKLPSRKDVSFWKQLPKAVTWK